MSRGSWVTCVADGHKRRRGLSWCGRRISMEFAFVSIDHAANSGRNGDRLTVCPGCRKAIVAALNNKAVPEYAIVPPEPPAPGPEEKE